MPANDASRDNFIDVLKGIGIVLVYCGHSVYWGTLPSRMIFCFHMPLFFFISGVLFGPERTGSAGRLLGRVARNLLIPYLLFCYVGFVMRIDAVFSFWQADPLRELIRIVHGEGSNAIWFLMCLASIQIIAWMVWRYAGVLRTKVCGAIALVAIIAGAQYLSECRSVRVFDMIPFMLASVPGGMIFFGLGFLFRDRIRAFGRARVTPSLLIAILAVSLGAFVCICLHTKGTLDLRTACFHVRHFVPSLLGIGSACLLARILVGSWRLNRVFAWLGKFSLCLFALEFPISHVLAKLTGVSFFERMFLVRHTHTAEVARVLVVLGVASLLAVPMMMLIEKTRAFFCGTERKGAET